MSVAASIAAGSLEDAVSAYRRADYATALRIYRSMADQGRADAQSNLGSMHAEGEGVPRDFVQALMWFTLSAAQNHKDGVENRDRAAGLMSPAQIAEAQKLAGAWKSTAKPVQ